MTWFTKEFITFFKALSSSNTKDFFDLNRKHYEQSVKIPFRNFVQEMINQISRHDGEVVKKAEDAIFRINRDVRFAKDKTPYNLYMAANISPYGRKSKEFPGFYFQMGVSGITIIGGAYIIEKDTLEKLRVHIKNNVKAFGKILENKNFKELYGEMQGEKSKLLSLELKEVSKTQPLITNKQFYYSAKLKPAEIINNQLPQVLLNYYKAARPLNMFLIDAYKTT